MSFIDEVRLFLAAGSGGNGCTSFRREKFVEFGGPDGGNGGKGGDISFITDSNLSTLLDLRYRKHIKAKDGKSGAGRNRSGAAGQNVILSVPLGTEIIDEDNGNIIVDLCQENTQFLAMRGGNGGLGNTNFKSSTNKAPQRFTYGHEGESGHVLLQLKTLSDVGIIGMPNAGKSKFLRRCSNTDSRVGDYPFTTIRPHLGIAKIDYNEIILADIPGIIEGAHLGVGLGHKFLKHIERCKMLLHLIDASISNVVSSYNCTHNELQLYSSLLLHKEEIVVLNKCDLLTKQEILDKKHCLSTHLSKEVFVLSIDDDVTPILRMIYRKLANISREAVKTYDPFA